MERGSAKPNTKPRWERENRGWSQTRVGQAIGTSKEMVSRWECGERPPGRYYQAKLCELFGKSAVELGFLEPPQPQEHVLSHPQTPYTQDIIVTAATCGGQNPALITHEESEDPLKRRDATHIIGALGLSLIAAPGALAQLTESLASFNTLEETFLAFEKLSEICWSLSQGNDLELAERVLWTYLPKVKALALPPSGQQQTVARIASQGYLLAASLSGNRNDLKARLHFSEQALMFANIAQDSNLQIAALRQLANTFDYLGCSDKVLQTYQQALPYLNEASPLLRARIYAGAAGSYAERGRKQDALRFLSLAYESFPENPQTDVSFRFADCGYYTLVLWEGLTQLELHQPEEAEKAFARADGLNTKIQIPGRVRAELLSSQATMFTELRRMDEACCYLQDAVKLSVAIGSTRRFHEAQSVFAQMKAIWGKEKSVKDLEDLFLA